MQYFQHILLVVGTYTFIYDNEFRGQMETLEEPALTRVQRSTPAVFLLLMTMTF